MKSLPLAAGEGAVEEAGNGIGGGDEFGDGKAGVNSHALEHVDEVLGGEVAGGAGGVGAAAESADGSIEGGDSAFQGCEDVGEGGPISIVEVEGQAARGDVGEEAIENAADVGGRGSAEGVADGDFVHAGIEQFTGHAVDFFLGDFALEGADEGGGDVAANGESGVEGAADEGPKKIERFGDGHADVFLGEGIRGGGEDGNALDARGEGAVKTPVVGHEGGKGDGGERRESGEKIGGIGQLGDGGGMDKGRGLDVAASGIGEGADQFDLGGGGDGGGFVLKSVAGRDFDEGNGLGQGGHEFCGSTRMRSAPISTSWPGWQAIF